MKNHKITYAFNIVAVVLSIFLIVVRTRVTHDLPSGSIMLFIPSTVWLLSIKNPLNRSIGGIAIIINGLLAATGVLMVIAYFLGAVSRTALHEQLMFFIASIFVAFLGSVNARSIFKIFPPIRKKN